MSYMKNALMGDLYNMCESTGADFETLMYAVSNDIDLSDAVETSRKIQFQLLHVSLETGYDFKFLLQQYNELLWDGETPEDAADEVELTAHERDYCPQNCACCPAPCMPFC